MPCCIYILMILFEFNFISSHITAPLASELVNKFGGHSMGVAGSMLVVGGNLCLAILSTLSTWGLFASVVLSGTQSFVFSVWSKCGLLP